MPIWFNGKCSTDLGILVEHRPVRQIAQRRLERIPVPGASRDIIQYQEDAWENVPQPYDIAIVPALRRSKDLPLYARQVMEWLHAPTDYVKLSDSYDPNMFRMAAYTATGEKIENMLAKFGRATITFDCDGRWFYQDGDVWQAVDLAESLTLSNPTPYKALPLISITATGSVGLVVNNYVNGTLKHHTGYILNIGTRSKTVRIDSEKKGDAKYSDGTNANGIVVVSGDPYPKLYPDGVNTIGIFDNGGELTGTVTSLSIKPRWFTV